MAQLPNYAGGIRTRTIIPKPKWVTNPLALTMMYRQCDLGSSQPSALPIELLQNDPYGGRTRLVSAVTGRRPRLPQTQGPDYKAL